MSILRHYIELSSFQCTSALLIKYLELWGTEDVYDGVIISGASLYSYSSKSPEVSSQVSILKELLDYSYYRCPHFRGSTMQQCCFHLVIEISEIPVLRGFCGHLTVVRVKVHQLVICGTSSWECVQHCAHWIGVCATSVQEHVGVHATSCAT